MKTDRRSFLSFIGKVPAAALAPIVGGAVVLDGANLDGTLLVRAGGSVTVQNCNFSNRDPIPGAPAIKILEYDE